MTIKLKELIPVLTLNYLAGINTYIAGKPAIGKTSLIVEFTEQMQKKIPTFRSWLFYAPTMSPMHIQASAPNYETHLLEMFNNQALPNAYNPADADAVGVVFFGELPNADPSVVKLLQKYINGEDMSGSLRKPKGVMVIADGNRLEDKSGVQQQGRAFLSRFEQHEAYTDATDNMEFASKHAWHPHVQLFFKEHVALIDNYDDVFETSASAARRSAQVQQNNGRDQTSEEGKRGIWANMRSWDRISRKEYVADKLKTKLTLAEITGNVGSGVGTAYDTFKGQLNALVSFADIMANPTTVDIPDALDELKISRVLVQV